MSHRVDRRRGTGRPNCPVEPVTSASQSTQRSCVSAVNRHRVSGGACLASCSLAPRVCALETSALRLFAQRHFSFVRALFVRTLFVSALFVASGTSVPLLASPQAAASQAGEFAIVLRAELMDGTRWAEAPGSEHAPRPLLKGARLRVTITAPADTRPAETAEHTQDLDELPDGRVDLDLGSWPLGSRIQLMAGLDGQAYLAYPLVVTEKPLPVTLPLYRMSGDAAGLRQQVLRIVTWQGSADDPWVHVRQILTIRNDRHEVLAADDQLMGPVAIYPVPEGAELLTLNTSQEASTGEQLRVVEGWGYGVPINGLLYPEITLVGTYRIPARAGEAFDLGLEAPIQTSFALSLEVGRFYYDPADPANGPALVSGGPPQQPSGVQQPTQPWGIESLAKDTPLRARVMVLGGEAGAPRQQPLRLHAILVDATKMFAGSHGQHGSPTSEHPLGATEVVIELSALDGTPETVRTRSDATGRVSLDLGMRRVGSSLLVLATEGEQRFASLPTLVEEAHEPRLMVFREARDPYSFRQHLLRIVTEQESVVERKRTVHVRQIQHLVHAGFEVVQPPALDEPAVVFFPVPRNAGPVSLTLDGEALVHEPAREDAHWGFGIPLRIAVGPRVLMLMGTYTLALDKNEMVDLGLVTPVEVERYELALEARRFHYQPPEAAAAGPPPALTLTGGEVTRVPDIERDMLTYRVLALPAGTRVEAPVRYGPAPVQARTVLITSLIVIGIAGAAGLGMALGRRRAGHVRRRPEQILEELAALDEQLVRGELSPSEHAEEQARLTALLDVDASGPPSSAALALSSERAAELAALLAERHRTPQELTDDFAALRALVRREFLPGVHRAISSAARNPDA